MTTMHPFARSPIRERSTSTASSAYFPGGYDINEQDDRREEEEDALRMMAYGEGTLPGGHPNDGRREGVGRRTEAEGSSSGSRSFKRVPRSPPPQGPPPTELPPVPPLMHRARNSSVSSSRTTSSIGHAVSPYLQTTPTLHPQSSPLLPRERQFANNPGPDPDPSSLHTSPQTVTPLARLPVPAAPARKSRVPSKDLLQSALDLAEKAVQCDKANDVLGALAMYRDAVGRLRCVMERVGIELGPLPVGLGLPEPTDSEKEDIAQARRRREASGHRSGEEGKILKGIHDAYISRIGLLVVMERGLQEANLPQATGEPSEATLDSDEVTARPSGRSSETSTGPTGIGRMMLETDGPDQASSSNGRTSHASDYRSKRKSLRSGEQLVEAIGGNGSADFHRDSLDADVNAYYPPAIQSPPIPRPRTSSRTGPDSGIEHVRRSFDDQIPRVNGVHVSLGPVVGTSRIDSTLSGSAELDASTTRASLHVSNTSITSMSTLGSPSSKSISTVTSGSSSQRNSERRLRLRTAHPTLGLEAEVSDQEKEEVLDRTPYAEGFPSLENGTNRYEPTRGYSNSSSLPDSSSSRSGRSSLTGLNPPSISPRSASLQDNYLQDLQQDLPPERSSSVQGIKGHDKGRSISSVVEEAETSYEMVDPRSLSTRRTTSLSNSRAPVTSNAYSTHRQAPFPSPGLADSTLSPFQQVTPRSRAVSQPSAGRSPGRDRFDASDAPPLPDLMRSPQVSLDQTGSMLPPPPPPRALTIDTSGPGSIQYAVSAASVSTATLMVSDSPDVQEVTLHSPTLCQGDQLGQGPSMPSSVTEPPPANPVHRPFHVLRLLRHTIVSPSGGFLSSRLHIPRAIWSQATVKLVSLDVKVRVIEVLILSSSSLARYGHALIADDPLGHDDGTIKLQRIRTDAPSRAKDFIRSLDDTDGLLDEMEKLLNKKLGLKAYTSSVKSKKMSTTGISVLGSKLTKTFDRIATGKNVDSPTAYVDSLSRLCLEAQVIDRHLTCFTGPSTAAYQALSPDYRNHIETRLRRLSDFMSNFIMTFVLQDVGFLLTKYLKQSSKWLED